MADVYEVYEGVVKGCREPLRAFDNIRDAENAADDMAMRGNPASVYEVESGKSKRVYAVSL